MAELFVPGVTVYLSPAKNITRKTRYTLVALERKGKPRFVDSITANKVFAKLFSVMPDFKKWKIQASEYTYGHSRFDFLLQSKNSKALVEVKTCTLIENSLAAFPDAVSTRAVKHIQGLVKAKENGYDVFIVFLISDNAKYFIPDYYTDPDFHKAFMNAYEKINIFAYSYEIDESLNIPLKVGLVDIPYEKLKSLNLNTGSYIICYHQENGQKIKIGKNREYYFEAGYYLYVGSALNSLSARTSRHKKKVKNKKWHVDYLHPPMKYIKTYNFNALDIECEISKKLEEFAEVIHGFGASDCRCAGHLFYLEENPDNCDRFIDFLFTTRFRSDYFD